MNLTADSRPQLVIGFDLASGTDTTVTARLPTPVHRAPWQDRVINELTELQTRLHGLTAFIDSELFDTVSAAEQGRLQRQKLIMIDYPAVLNERVAAW